MEFWDDAKIGAGWEGSITRKGLIADRGVEVVFCTSCLGIEFINDLETDEDVLDIEFKKGLKDSIVSINILEQSRAS